MLNIYKTSYYTPYDRQVRQLLGRKKPGNVVINIGLTRRYSRSVDDSSNTKILNLLTKLVTGSFIEDTELSFVCPLLALAFPPKPSLLYAGY